VKKLSIAGMEENNVRVMLAAKLQKMIDDTPLRGLACLLHRGNGLKSDLSIDGDPVTARIRRALQENACHVDSIIHRAIEHRGIHAVGQIIAAAQRPFPVPIDDGRLFQSKVPDIQMGMIRGVDSKFCASTRVPGDILTDHKREIVLVTPLVNALVAEHEGKG
jgi:hypothetical protein